MICYVVVDMVLIVVSSINLSHLAAMRYPPKKGDANSHFIDTLLLLSGTERCLSIAPGRRGDEMADYYYVYIG